MRSSTTDLALLTMLAAGVAYFLVDGWFGASGRAGLGALEREIRVEERKIAELETARDALKRKTEALSGPSVDADLLDETARAAFGLARSDENLILAPDRQ